MRMGLARIVVSISVLAACAGVAACTTDTGTYTVVFDDRSANITLQGSRAIARAAADARAQRGSIVEIAGYPATPVPDYATLRLDQVATALTGYGVQPGRIVRSDGGGGSDDGDWLFGDDDYSYTGNTVEIRIIQVNSGGGDLFN